jgi:hypothetical protein
MHLRKKLDDILGVKVTVLKEDARPSSGIWYYVWLAPKWERVIVKHSEFGPYGHPKFWENYIADKIVKHYKLKLSDLAVVKELCYSMPRGRVDYVPKSDVELVGEKPDTWYMDFGGDIPGDVESEQRHLISGFNLTGFAIRNKVEFRVVPHEKMLETHKDAMQKLIGDVPY